METGSGDMLPSRTQLRLTVPTIAVARDSEGRQVGVIVPAGEIITPIDDVYDRTELVLVDWAGKSCQMFSQDLQARGDIVDWR